MPLEGRDHFSFCPVKVPGKDLNQQMGFLFVLFVFFFFFECRKEELLLFPVVLLLG